MPARVPKRWIRNPSDELAVRQGCTFKDAAGKFACDFVEGFCRQSQGKWGGQKIELIPWQRDFLMRLFGWKLPNGLRRFRRCYLEIAKKNGKSTLVSALALLLLIADGEHGPKVYLNAINRDQARIVFEEAVNMVEASPDLKGRLDVIKSQHRIVCPANAGLIRCNSADAPSKDGLNPHGVIFDELHRQKDASLWDIFEHADAAREQPLWISITTAGEDESGVWWAQRDYSEKVNAGTIPDITHLGVVYRADPEDDIESPETWRKANPSLGYTVTEEYLALKLRQAKEEPRKLADFRRLRLNIVTKADVVFLDPAEWAACGPADRKPVRPDLAALRGVACHAGLDLSRTTDLTALVALWGGADEDLDLAAWFWMPEGMVKELERRDRQPYRHWIDAGWIIATDGDVVDYGFIRKQINDLAAEHDLRKLLIDPYNATQLAGQLKDEDGLPIEFIRQGFLSLSAPTKELERLVKARKLRHGCNPVLAWMAGNAIAERDAADNVKLSKKKSRQKIDGLSALVNAIAAATGNADETSVYETRGILTL